MSKYSVDKLADGNILVGNGHRPWWFHADRHDASVLYPGAIPVADVESRLFAWHLESAPVALLVPCTLDDPEMTNVGPDGKPFKIVVQGDRQGVIRSDNGAMMGLFKSGYKIHQYREWLLETVSTILNDDLVILSAGVLGNGQVAWVKVGLTESATAGGLTYNTGLLAVTSANGTIASGYGRSNTLEVCDNTLTAGLGETKENNTRVKVKHSKYSGFRLESAREALQIIARANDEMGQFLEDMASVKVTDSDFSAVVHALNPIPADEGIAQTKAYTKHGQLNGLWLRSPMVAPVKGTAMGILQAFNTWEHHIKGVRKDTVRQERNQLEAIDGTIEASDRIVMDTMRELSILV